MILDNNFKTALDADINRHLATAKGTPPQRNAMHPPPAISATTAPLMAFPLDTLPPKAKAYIDALEYANGIPPDFMAAAMIWATAVAIGNAAHLEIKPGTTFSAISFLGLIGAPNANKTQALRAALLPISEADKLAFDQYKTGRDTYEAAQAMSKEDRKTANITDIQRPVYKKILLSDYTPEALSAAHAVRTRGVSVFVDELIGLIKRLNRYNAGAEAELMLSLWSAAALAVDRKAFEPIYIKDPHICFSGTLQPAVLAHLAADDRGQNGFLDRFLFCWPDGLVKPKWDDRGIDLNMRDAYSTSIGRLLSMTDDTRVITLADDARKALFTWFNDVNKPLCDAAPNEGLAGLHGKYDIHAARIILALHCLNFAYSADATLPTEIDVDTVSSGLRIAEYFRAQSMKVHTAIFAADPVDALPTDRRKLYNALPEKFKTAEGIAIATGPKHGMPERTFKAWIKNRDLFEKVAHGVYARCL